MQNIYEVNINPETGQIKYKKVDEDYYSLNLDVTAQLKLYGFELNWLFEENRYDLRQAETFLMDFNFDFNSMGYDNRWGDSFKRELKKVKEIKATIRDQNIDKVIA